MDARGIRTRYAHISRAFAGHCRGAAVGAYWFSFRLENGIDVEVRLAREAAGDESVSDRKPRLTAAPAASLGCFEIYCKNVFADRSQELGDDADVLRVHGVGVERGLVHQLHH